MQKIGDIPNTRADSNGEFTDGNVAGGVPPTILPAAWFNTLQRELMSILAAAEIEADPHSFNQVLSSIQKLVSDGIPDLKDASLNQKGIVQLSNATNSTSEKTAATPRAVKAAIDTSLPVGGTAKAAEKLATARKISGVDFDGSKDIILPFINTTDTNIQLPGALTAVDAMHAGRLLSKSDLIAGEGRAEGHATLAVDGNVHGTVWGGALSSYLSGISNSANNYGVVALARGASVVQSYTVEAPAGTYVTNSGASTMRYRALFFQRPGGAWVQMGGDIG